ncbi:type IIL restriction-modification enzyme MmeI [Effusibacillus consociatus]|uniref:site-specific DNA-methyltransferase (adenine-specific) n=1 Tax=Effusibacillus consociatus TaxID=1117041 RepID=A0ABV9PXC4_9BACL
MFILQCVFAMFAEDIALLPRQHFTNVLLDCIKKKERTGDTLFLLFQRLNEQDERKRRGRDIPYFNGGLFKDVYVIDLTPNEIEQLLEACKSDWSMIRPEIFGTLFEHSMSEDERSQRGAHFTSEVDIQRIVQPTIVRPWTCRLNFSDPPK